MQKISYGITKSYFERPQTPLQNIYIFRSDKYFEKLARYVVSYEKKVIKITAAVRFYCKGRKMNAKISDKHLTF